MPEVSEEGHENPHSKMDGIPKEIRKEGLPSKGLCPSTNLLGDIFHMSQYSFRGLLLQRPIVFVILFYDAVGISKYLL